MKSLLIGIIRAYQLVVSPYFPSSCRYHPTCSQYALDAVRRHGAIRGSWLGLKRIARCHPWSTGGHDPVPDSNGPVPTQSGAGPDSNAHAATPSGTDPDAHHNRQP